MILGLGLRLEAGEAVVRTRDGTQWRGQARLETNTVVVASLAPPQIVRIFQTNLLALRFTTKPEYPFEPNFNRPAPIQSRWAQTDVGFNQVPGQSRIDGGPIWMATGGSNIAARADAFRYVYMPMKGDGEIVAHLSQLRPATQDARAGLMLRESTETGAKNVFLGLARRGGVFQWRPEQDQLMQGRDSMFRNRWIRLKRAGDQILGYVSRNGRQWELIERTTLSMNEEILAGLALTGCPESVPATAKAPAWNWSQCRFDSVQMGQALRFHSFTPNILLQSGSSIASDIAMASSTELFYAGPNGLDKVRLGNISRIDFYWVPSRHEAKLRRGQPGALLASGEFIEGELRGLSGGQCTLNSILFGLRSFDVNSEVVSIVLGPPPRPTPSATCVLHSWSGGSWLGTDLRIEPAGMRVHDRSMGAVQVAYHDLKAFELLPPR